MNENTSMFVVGCVVTFFIIAVFFGIGGGGKYEGFSAEELYSDLAVCESQLDDYKLRINSANNDIEVTNNIIHDIVYAESYDELRDSINSLSEIDLIPED